MNSFFLKEINSLLYYKSVKSIFKTQPYVTLVLEASNTNSTQFTES